MLSLNYVIEIRETGRKQTNNLHKAVSCHIEWSPNQNELMKGPLERAFRQRTVRTQNWSPRAVLKQGKRFRQIKLPISAISY